LIPTKILKYNANPTSQRFNVPFLQVTAIQQDTTIGRIIEAGEEFNQCRLARTVLTDECQTFARLNLQTDIATFAPA